MKRMMRAAAGWALVTLAAGCATPTGVSPLYTRMQNKASRLNDNGGLAAVGVGSSKDLSMATKMATSRGRTETAAAVQTRVNELVKDFREQIGDVDNAEFNQLFSSAGKQLTSQMVTGITAREVETETKNGVITVYALMWQSPKAIKEFFANQKNSQAALYQRFRASQAFGELDKDIERFEAFLKQEGAKP